MKGVRILLNSPSANPTPMNPVSGYHLYAVTFRLQGKSEIQWQKAAL